MKMPNVVITFSEKAATAIQNGERGIVAMILKEATLPSNVFQTYYSVNDISEDDNISEANVEQIKLALKGYQTSPRKVIVYFIKSGEGSVDYKPALDRLANEKFQYLVIPTVATDSKTEDIVSWIKSEREKNDHMVKAVLPNTKADSEAIINYTTESVTDNNKSYTAEQYCSRIAGILAGTPLTIASTYAPLTELIDCTKKTRAEMDAAVEAGEFFVYWDGEKVKTSRAVNSLTTLTQDKNTQFQKIKIVECMDMIYDDIKTTIEDDYLGKYANSYDNKCLLVSAINNYFDSLVSSGILGSGEVKIDTEAVKAYLNGRGVDTSEMTEIELKEANTGSNLFLTATLSILDAIEDVTISITI